MKNIYDERKAKMIDWLGKEMAQIEELIHSALEQGDFIAATRLKGMRDGYYKSLEKLQNK